MPGRTVIAIGRGASPIPTAVKAARGTLKSSRVNPGEPQGEAIPIPPPPDDFPPPLKKTWIDLAAQVDPMRITSAAHIEGFALMVTSIAICRSASATLFDPVKNPTFSMTYVSKTGAGNERIQKWPELEVLAQHQKIAAYWLSRFGLTPADSQRVSTLGDSSTNDPLNEFGT